MRACSCNIVVLAQNQKEAASLPSVLAEVSEWHPCRSLIAYHEDNGRLHEAQMDAPMQAWISAQCWLPFAGGPQICCEAITVAARGDAAHDLPNTLVSLLVPDLPVFLYWRSFRISDQELIEGLAQFSDLLIVDSHASKDNLAERERLLDLLRHPPGGVPIRDLNWSRLTAWRELIAQFFDPPGARHYAHEISEIEVRRFVAKPGNVPTRTLLLIAWLATRLKWRRISAERRGDEWISRWENKAGEVLVRLVGSYATSSQAPGIQGITLRTRTGASFTVVQEAGATCLTATASIHGSVLVHSVPKDPLDEATLLSRELSIAGEDQGFQIALTEALELEKAFR
jgi:glucose-6-phosphate dehydrogenase assembly protein OpcA